MALVTGKRLIQKYDPKDVADLKAEYPFAEFNEKGTECHPRVDENGVHPDHEQREGPLPVALHIDNPTEGRRKQETDAAAKQRPTWRPDALDDRADAGEVQQQSRGNADRARNQ